MKGGGRGGECGVGVSRVKVKVSQDKRGSSFVSVHTRTRDSHTAIQLFLLGLLATGRSKLGANGTLRGYPLHGTPRDPVNQKNPPRG